MMQANAAADPAEYVDLYICPACKASLRRDDSALRCVRCARVYLIEDGIPDFVHEELGKSADPVLRRMRYIDRMARIYETSLWYPVVLKLYGGFRSPSLAQLVATVARTVRPSEGRLLDVACGPGTFGRRVASPRKELFGIDVSMGMLRQGVVYTRKEGIRNMHFARARVEALPFPDAFFDATICCGSLHLFADTVAALREMARVMKPGAVLCVFTFTAGRGGLLRFRGRRERLQRKHGLHVFELPEIEQELAAAGFTDFDPVVSGSILTFGARKRAD